ncbi:fumarylacetoacetate hydrolase family protein [Nocardia sp. NPDC003183]
MEACQFQSPYSAVADRGAIPVVNFGLVSIVHNGESCLAAAVGDVVHPLAQLLTGTYPSSLEDAFQCWDDLIITIASNLEGPDAASSAVPAAQVEFRTPTTASPSIWCAGANYTDHVAEMGVSDIEKIRSFHFLSPTTVLNKHRGVVHRPAGVTQLDWEIELAVVIGRTARRIVAEEALSYVAGYTIANDVSVRDPDVLIHPFFGVDWTSTKNPDGLTPIGPMLVPARFVPDPANLDLLLTVNGQCRQDSNTSLMIIDVPAQIAALSNLVTLRPGDIILTGTPAGTAAAHQGAYLADGDVVVATIEGLGTLENVIA